MSSFVEIKPSIFKSKEIFLSLPSPTSIPTGTYRVVWIGPNWFVSLARFSLALVSFQNWWGKDFSGSTRSINLFSQKNSEALLQKYPMNTAITKSKLDGRDAIQLTYGKDSPFPWFWFVDEFREFSPSILLGVSYLKWLPGLALPFAVEKGTSS
ncbi:hypothetical protein LPTSP4_24030 [Leptospira ryugenii]|uniref:Uncharacterized protein n=1 Tax=Leptospira ryugenii TaxID=1917863 RepID=A0A2P2E240_9LEPT|nr:hypothetical protein LPTSP4_24030 [Leptospira ryugenii]